MAQNVTIAGNQYPDVPSILVPKTGGGGNAIFADPSVVTAVAADVASGKYFLDSSGVLTQGTASGGGGASNIVTGTFKGTTTNAAMDVTLNYTGSGYPIAIVVFPNGGPTGDSTFSTTVQRYAASEYCSIKLDTSVAPTYNGSTSPSQANNASVMLCYKGTSATSRSSARNAAYIYNNAAPTGTNAQTLLRIKSATTFSVFIAGSEGTLYGFMANVEYKYLILYSS